MILMTLMDVAPEPSAADLALLPVMVILAAILVLSVTFLALLVFFLIRYKRRQLASAIQTEPLPGVGQFAQPAGRTDPRNTRNDTNSLSRA